MKIASAFIVAVALSVVAGAQTASELAGVWKLDPARSSIKLGPRMSEMTLTIKRTDTEVLISRDVMRDNGQGNVARLAYRIGEVSSNTIYGETETATAVFPNAGRLMITGERTGHKGTRHRFQLAISLSDDGNELLVEDEDYLGTAVASSKQYFTRNAR